MAPTPLEPENNARKGQHIVRKLPRCSMHARAKLIFEQLEQKLSDPTLGRPDLKQELDQIRQALVRGENIELGVAALVQAFRNPPPPKRGPGPQQPQQHYPPQQQSGFPSNTLGFGPGGPQQQQWRGGGGGPNFRPPPAHHQLHHPQQQQQQFGAPGGSGLSPGLGINVSQLSNISRYLQPGARAAGGPDSGSSSGSSNISSSNISSSEPVGDPFSAENLKRQNPHVIHSLYMGTPLQCKTCGLRLVDQTTMSKHLDWHFKLYQREQKRAKQALSAQWYLTRTEWIMHTDILLDEVPSVPFFEKEAEEARAAALQAAIADTHVKADDSQISCPICGDEFKTKFDDDAEEWVYANTLRVSREGGEGTGGEKDGAAAEVVEDEATEAMKALRKRRRLEHEDMYFGKILHTQCSAMALAAPELGNRMQPEDDERGYDEQAKGEEGGEGGEYYDEEGGGEEEYYDEGGDYDPPPLEKP